ncbi:hypothetical protein [Phascolarctobacterium faecium]|jgi:hypothetical protein|uniref:hypothetical protein n=1 Tax=Phascolarctobacterium faecium TaxID=33025 RepID=UPI00351FAFBC
MYICTFSEFKVMYNLRNAYKKTDNISDASQIFFTNYGLDSQNIEELPAKLHADLIALSKENLLTYTEPHQFLLATRYETIYTDPICNIEITTAGRRYFYDLILNVLLPSGAKIIGVIGTLIGIFYFFRK